MITSALHQFPSGVKETAEHWPDPTDKLFPHSAHKAFFQVSVTLPHCAS